MRRQVYNILIDNKSYLNLALKNIKSDNINQITIRVYGIVQNYSYLLFIIDQVTERKKLDDKTILILQMAFYEKLFLNSIPDYTIISEYQNLCREINYKALKYVSYILNNKIEDLSFITPTFKDEDKNLSITYSHPKWLVKKLKKQYPECYLDILKANNHRKPITARVIKELESPTEFNFIYDDFVELKNSLYQTKDFLNENLIIQDLGSYLVSNYMTSNKVDNVVLDLCAAPGNKTMHLATKFSQVYCNEISESRYNLLNNNLTKYGIINTCSFNCDAGNFEDLNNVLKGKKFDYILVDAPCSGIGTIRSKPEIRLTISQLEIERLIELQYNIFKNALNFLSEDGVILYSTCSINKEENEMQIEKFIDDFKLEELIDDNYKEFDSTNSKYGITLLPFLKDSDGFYMCKLKRKNNE